MDSTRRDMANLLVAVVGVASMLALTGCECGTPLEMDAGVDAGDGGGLDAGPDVDASRPDAARPDAGPEDGGMPQPPLCPDGRTHYESLPRRCADEPIPGFRLRPDGWYHPCNCFERGDDDALRTVPTACVDEGLRTVPFDCSWPPGTIYFRESLTTGPVVLGPTGLGCESGCEQGVVPGFYRAPYQQTFRFVSPDPRLPVDQVCFPVECVFDTPGQPARCSEECAEFTPDLGGYITTYRVDRSACEDAGATGEPDGGTTYPPFPGC